MKGNKSPTFYRKAPMFPSVAKMSGGGGGGQMRILHRCVYSCSNREVGGCYVRSADDCAPALASYVWCCFSSITSGSVDLIWTE